MNKKRTFEPAKYAPRPVEVYDYDKKQFVTKHRKVVQIAEDRLIGMIDFAESKGGKVLTDHLPIRNRTPVTIECDEGHIFNTDSYHTLIKGCWCQECSWKRHKPSKTNKAYTINQLIKDDKFSSKNWGVLNIS